MYKYLAINLIFVSVLVLIITALIHLYKIKLAFKAIGIALIALFIMTAVFDSFIVKSGIVAYDTSKILGIYIIKAPLEDFMYSLASIIGAACLWEWLSKSSD